MKCNIQFDKTKFQRCSTCKDIKCLTMFSKGTASCKACNAVYYKNNKLQRQLYIKENYENIKLRQRAYVNDNKERITQYNKSRWMLNKPTLQKKNKLYVQTHKSEIKEYLKRFHKENKEHVKQYTVEYRKRNKEKLKEQRRERSKTRKLTDPTFKLSGNLRNRFQRALTNQKGWKYESLSKILGCSMEFARSYLETLFLPGMTWLNYGDWEIDHIIPCASFDLSKLEDQKKCFHFTNLQPLWWLDNVKKGDKLNWSP